jgi:exonuclease VII small subunit
MESTSSMNPINISITKNNEKIEDEYSEFKDYIIKNNIQLQKNAKENDFIIKDLERQLANLEETEEKYDNRMRYMKGLLQNLNELRNEYSKITRKTEDKFNLVKQHHTNTKKIYYEIYIYLIVINVLTIFTPFKNYIKIYYLILQSLYCIITPFCLVKIKNKYFMIVDISKEATNSMKSITAEINLLKIEIKKTEDSCISIDNWICEV